MLPPRWVKVFSWLFLIFLVIPVFAAWQIFDTGAQLGVSAFGLDLEGDTDPLAWMLAMDAVLFLAALTGLFILTRRSFAYTFGIFYGLTAIVVTVSAHFRVGDWDESAWMNIAVQYPLLVCFLVHLFRNHARWRAQYTNAAEKGAPNAEPA